MDPEKKKILERFSKVPLVCSDGGRETEGFYYEKDDCTVRAVAHATSISYAEAHELLKRHGREDRQGAYFTSFMLGAAKGMCTLGGRHAYSVGVRIRDGVPRRTTVQTFVREHPKGRYLLTIREHALAVVDGVVHDNQRVRGRSIVLNAWRLCFSGPQSALQGRQPGI